MTFANGLVDGVVGDNAAIAAARRRYDAALELLQSFEPTAEQLDAVARFTLKIAHKGISPRKAKDEDE